MSEQKKICTNCKIEKSLDNYYFRKDINKHETQCKVCLEDQITNLLKNITITNSRKAQEFKLLETFLSETTLI